MNDFIGLVIGPALIGLMGLIAFTLGDIGESLRRIAAELERRRWGK